MKYLFFYLLLLSSYVSAAQNERLDSLKQAIEHYTLSHDSSYIELRLTFVTQSILSGIGDSTVLEFTEQTRRLSEELDYKKGIVRAIQRIGVLYQYFFNDPIEAINYYHEALDLIGDSEYLRPQKFESYNNLATIYFKFQDYQKALEINLMVVELGLPKYGKSLLDIGKLYTDIKQYDSAIYFFEKAIDTLKKITHEKDIFMLESAELATTYMNLANVYIETQVIDSALANHYRASELVESYEIGYLRPRTFINAGRIYLLVDSIDKAEKHINEALEYPIGHMSLEQQFALYRLMHEVYKKQDRYQSALLAFENAKVIEDSILSQNKRVELERNAMEYEKRNQELEVQEKVKMQKLITWLTIASALVFVVVLSIVFFLNQSRKKAESRANAVKFEKELAKTKLSALRSQLNPHFIFNALNAIGQYMVSHGSSAAQEYLVKFSKLIRMVLENSDEDWILLDEDLEVLKLYINIASLRLSDKLKFTLDVASTLDTSKILIPSLILQPFIENCFEHGFTNTSQDYTLRLHITEENDTIVYTLEDNGTGLLYNRSSKSHKAMGTEITRKRLEIASVLTKKIGAVTVSGKEPGVRVILRTPYKLASDHL